MQTLKQLKSHLQQHQLQQQLGVPRSASIYKYSCKVTGHITPQLYKLILAESKKENCSVSAVVRDILENAYT